MVIRFPSPSNYLEIHHPPKSTPGKKKLPEGLIEISKDFLAETLGGAKDEIQEIVRELQAEHQYTAIPVLPEPDSYSVSFGSGVSVDILSTLQDIMNTNGIRNPKTIYDNIIRNKHIVIATARRNCH